MDPMSEIKIQGDEDQNVVGFSPLFASSPGLAFGFDNENEYQHLQIDESFWFPIDYDLVQQQQDLPNSITPDPYYPWNSNQELQINPSAEMSSWCMGDSQLQLVIPPLKKKEHHNASERMRRMRLKVLYASLGSVLPFTDQKKKKKQTAPTTVECVIKYIPVLEEEVETLIRRKQELSPSTSYVTPNDTVLPQFTPAAGSNTTSEAPPATWSIEAKNLGNGQISILISTPKSLINTFIPISEVLRMLEEEERFLVLDISSADSSAGRVFYHIHLREEGSDKMDSELLRKKLLSSCQKWEEMCLWMITQGM